MSALAPWLLTRETALLLVGGFVVGIFSVIIGGGFFFSIPLLQLLFPSVSYGAVVGNLKVGSFFRGIGSTITNRKEIDWLRNLLWSVPLVTGTALGVMVIAHLHQRWMLPAIIAAIAFSELAPWLAKRITKGSFKLGFCRHRGDLGEHLRSKLAQRSRGTALLGTGLGPLVETYGYAVPGVHKRNRVGDVGDLLAVVMARQRLIRCVRRMSLFDAGQGLRPFQRGFFRL